MVCQLANHTDSPDRLVSISDHWQDIVRRLDGQVSVYPGKWDMRTTNTECFCGIDDARYGELVSAVQRARRWPIGACSWGWAGLRG
jgi:hypothetical protein